MVGVASTLGAILGPVVAGRIFDVTANYTNAFILFSAVAFTGAVATLACTGYRTGQHQAPLPAFISG